MPLESVHPDYAAHAEDWKTLRDAFAGSRAIRGGRQRYIPKPGGMNDTQYTDYLARGEWYNATARTVIGMRGEVFRKDPKTSVPEPLTPALSDITGQGLTFLDFAKRVTQEVLHMGHYGVLIDLPSRPDADAPQPLWCGYPVEQIRNWAFRDIGGRWQLSRLVLAEHQWAEDPEDAYELRPSCTYRLLELDDRGVLSVRRFAQMPDRNWVPLGEALRPQRRGEPLTFIPFVLFGPAGLEWCLDDSPLLPLVQLNLRHWRHACDYDHGLHLVALPTLCITGHNLAMDVDDDGTPTTTIVLGSQGGICLPEPDAKVYMLEFHGQGLTALETALQTDKKEMATMGARLLEETPSVEEREVSVLHRQSGDASVLRTIASTVSHGLTRCWQLHAWWAGATELLTDPEIQVALNRDFLSSRLNAQDLQALVLSWQARAISYETLHWNLTSGEVMEPGIDAETERARIEAEPPLLAPPPAEAA